MTASRVPHWWWPPLAAAAIWLAPWPAAWIENAYARGFYRLWQAALTTVSNLAPWTWLDVFIIAAAGLAGWRATRLLQEVRTTSGARVAVQAVKRVIRAVGVVALAFLLCWGLNYRRTPLMTALGEAPPAPNVDTLRQLVNESAALAARTRPYAKAHLLGYDEIAARLSGPMTAALASVDRPRLIATGRPKYSLMTPFFTRAGVTGMVDPLALESIVHPDLLPFERAFVLAHEWGHLAGLADEAEASAVGWAACMRGDDVLVYSGAMYLLVEAGGALPARVWKETAATLDPGVRDDLSALAERLTRIQPAVRDASFKVYDQYLKANSVEDGVRSYSRALELIVLPEFRASLTDPAGGRADRVRRP